LGKDFTENNLELYLNTKTWNADKKTYAGTDIEDNWNALNQLFE
jgi:hypothetical protein